MADNERPDGVDRRVAEDISVPSEDPAGKEKKDKATTDGKGKEVDGKKEVKEDEIVSIKIRKCNAWIRRDANPGRCWQSEEDLQLKNELEMLVERLKVSRLSAQLPPPPLIRTHANSSTDLLAHTQESDKSLHMPALESLRTLIKTSTSSMTSVPKPLKFLRPFYAELIELSEKMGEGAERVSFNADQSSSS